MRRVPALLIAASVVAVVAATPSDAAVGVAVRWGFLTIPKPLVAGKHYRLPMWGVRNPGSEGTTYRMQANGVRGQSLLAPGPRWFRFSRDTVTLSPGRERAVRITLVVPKSARPGKYMALVKAAIAPSTGGAGVGVAAGARVLFRVRATR